jgi:hypothetical protein
MEDSDLWTTNLLYAVFGVLCVVYIVVLATYLVGRL